jgi:hypothetical protein
MCVVKLLLAVLLTLSVLATVGCGNVFVRGVINPGSSSISGQVSVVQLTVVDGNVQATFVTFLSAGSSSTMGFCGDQRSRFPLDQTLRADFHRGQPCSNIITVVVLI